MAPGKTRDDEKEAKPEKKQEPEGDPLAALIDNYAEEIEPVAPAADDAPEPGENS